MKEIIKQRNLTDKIVGKARKLSLATGGIFLSTTMAITGCGDSGPKNPTPTPGVVKSIDTPELHTKDIVMPDGRSLGTYISEEIAKGRTGAEAPKPLETPMPVPGIRVEKGNATTGEISGFNPDDLRRSIDVLPLEITGESIVKYRNFSATLEKAQADGTPALAGYMYDKNDFSDDPAMPTPHHAAIQFPAYAWTVLTGQEADVNGIGHLTARPQEAVMLVVLNREKTVEHHDNVTLKHGFQASGRIWNGQPEILPNGKQNLATLEQGLVSHFLGSLFMGEDTKFFVGQCNDGDKNCFSVLIVSVERHQSGLNDDGSPRMVDRLIRSERISITKP